MIKIVETFGVDENGSGTYEINAMRDEKRIAGFSAYPLWECPEDATLERDMSFAYDALRFFKLGYEAGKAGELVEYEEKQEEEE